MWRTTCATSFIIIACSSLSRGDESDVRRFSRDYPRAAERWQARFARVRGSFRLLKQPRTGNGRFDETRGKFELDHGFRKITTVQEMRKGGSTEVVYCVDRDLSFKLTRGLNASTYHLQSLVRGDPLEGRIFDTLFGQYLTAPFSIGGVPLTEFMSQPTFQVDAAEPVKSDGRDLLKVHFSCGKGRTYTAGELVFDPALSWAIRESKLQFGETQPGRQSFKIEYDQGSAAEPTPRYVELEDFDRLTKRCEILDIGFAATPEVEFKLAFYGLANAEATPKSSPGSRTAYMLAGLAFVAIIASFALRRVGRRLR